MEKKSRADSLSYWRDIIRQCNARPEGQSGKEWLIRWNKERKEKHNPDGADTWRKE